MKRRIFFQKAAITTLTLSVSGFKDSLGQVKNSITRKIFVTGGGYDPATMKYLIALTGKEKPKICFLPTAVGDNETHIHRWFEEAKLMPIQPFVQRVFITSTDQTTSFEEVLLDMDAILVAGGNTLNLIALWKVHGIDKILRRAWDKGIVLSGPSAGAICWFEQGLSDSRPKTLSVVEGLGFLKGSVCPHYHSEINREETYKLLIRQGQLKPGYALDDMAGLYFENTTLKKVVSQDKENKAYSVSVINGEIMETPLAAKPLS